MNLPMWQKKRMRSNHALNGSIPLLYDFNFTGTIRSD